MSTVRAAPARVRLPAVPGGVVVVACAALAALWLARSTGARHAGELATVVRGLAGALVLFAVAGEGLVRRCAPPALAPLRPLLVVPVGAMVAGLALTALGFARVPLAASVALVLVAGVGASAWARRRPAAALDVPSLAVWAAVVGLVLAVALIPVWRLDVVTVFGENPDSHQVTGSAVLFQHAPPDAIRPALPIDQVPSAWRFRYPIIYALAGTSELTGLDPIQAFPLVSALVLAIAAIGLGLLAACALRLAPAGGAAVAFVTALSTVPLHLAWHPYYNQLWGVALIGFAVLFGWRALADRSAGAAVLAGVALVAVALAYPLMAPYPLVALAALAVALRGWPRLRPPGRGRLAGRRAWVAAALVALALAVPLVGAAAKLRHAARMLFDPHAVLWGGDIGRFVDPGAFAGTGGGWWAAAAVLAAALVALAVFAPRPEAIALGGTLVVFAAFDLRLRLVDSGPYMDFKHLSVVGALAVALAAGGAVAAVARGGGLAVAGVALLSVWTVAALGQARDEVGRTAQQVTPQMLELRGWAASLPPGASVRIDVPPSGIQLWVQYLMAARPVSAPGPVLFTTYAHAPKGIVARYSIAPRKVASRDPTHAATYPRPGWAVDPPVRENAQFVLRRIEVPPGPWRTVPDVSSQRMVQP